VIVCDYHALLAAWQRPLVGGLLYGSLGCLDEHSSKRTGGFVAYCDKLCGDRSSWIATTYLQTPLSRLLGMPSRSAGEEDLRWEPSFWAAARCCHGCLPMTISPTREGGDVFATVACDFLFISFRRSMKFFAGDLLCGEGDCS